MVDLCPGLTTLDGVEPISATFQEYTGDPALGPFAAVNVYELAPGDADVVMGRYEQALTDCAEYTSQSDSGEVIAGYSSRDLGSYGDASSGYAVVGTVGGGARKFIAATAPAEIKQ